MNLSVHHASGLGDPLVTRRGDERPRFLEIVHLEYEEDGVRLVQAPPEMDEAHLI